MTYRIQPDEDPAAALRRIAAEQLDRAEDETSSALSGRTDLHETVHTVRKRCKKLRGLLRLYRGSLDVYGDENRHLRDAARRLSALRDAQSLLGTLDDLAARHPGCADEALASARLLLEERRERQAPTATLADRLREVRDDLRQCRRRVADWRPSGTGFDLVAEGLGRTYGRALRGPAAADRDAIDDAFHEWRKRVKYHWHHMRLLQAVWPDAIRARRRESRRLAGLLGDDHDLAVLRRVLYEPSRGTTGTAEPPGLEALIAEDQRRLRGEARLPGRRLFAEEREAFVRRIAAYWLAARDADPPGPPPSPR